MWLLVLYERQLINCKVAAIAITINEMAGAAQAAFYEVYANEENNNLLWVALASLEKGKMLISKLKRSGKDLGYGKPYLCSNWPSRENGSLHMSKLSSVSHRYGL